VIFLLSENSFYDRAKEFVSPLIQGKLTERMYFDLQYVYGGADSGTHGCLWRVNIESCNSFGQLVTLGMPSSLVTSDDSLRALLEDAIENSSWE
jgi:hypothetical protein